MALKIYPMPLVADYREPTLSVHLFVLLLFFLSVFVPWLHYSRHKDKPSQAKTSTTRRRRRVCSSCCGLQCCWWQCCSAVCGAAEEKQPPSVVSAQVPFSLVGRIAGVFLMICGILVIALPMVTLSANFQMVCARQACTPLCREPP